MFVSSLENQPSDMSVLADLMANCNLGDPDVMLTTDFIDFSGALRRIFHTSNERDVEIDFSSALRRIFHNSNERDVEIDFSSAFRRIFHNPYGSNIDIDFSEALWRIFDEPSKDTFDGLDISNATSTGSISIDQTDLDRALIELYGQSANALPGFHRPSEENEESPIDTSQDTNDTPVISSIADETSIESDEGDGRLVSMEALNHVRRVLFD